MTLHVRGVHYDVGHHYDTGQGQGPGTTRPHFGKAGVQADMAIIAGQLHANAVRVTGTDLSRVAVASGLQRSEGEQSRYLRELLAIFGEEGIHGAFWHTFAGWTFPHRPDPHADLDLGSFGLVKVIEAPSAHKQAFVLEPKEAFWALAAAYRQAGCR